MSKELIIVSKPQLPEHWDYDESLKIGKQLFIRWKDITIEMAEHFYIAREILRQPGRRTDIQPSVKSSEVEKDWGDYCQEVSGIEDKKNARDAFNRMLRTVFPQELPEYEETAPLLVSRGLIYKKDALEFLAGLDDESIDLLLTDPPYMTELDDIAGFVMSWVPLALSKVKNSGRAYIFTGAYPKETHIYFSELMKEKRFILAEKLIWFYRNRVGVQSKMKYKSTYQNIFHLHGKYAKTLNFPSEWSLEHIDVQDVNAPDARHEVYYHAHQKPDEIARRFIEHSTNEGDLIIDPFAGTGTFILIALSLGRDALGSEIDDGMLKICKKRGLEVWREKELRT